MTLVVLAVLVGWIVGLVGIVVVELRTDPPELHIVPRCLRCNGPRFWGHRCRDAVEPMESKGRAGVDR